MVKENNDIATTTLKRLDFVITLVYIWIVFVIMFIGILPPLISGAINYNNVIFASAGTLTFIAIFYSLLVSREGKKVTDAINEILTTLEKRVRESVQEEIGKTKNIKKTLLKFGTKTARINFVKRFSNMDYILLITVISLLLSIYLTLIDSDIYRISSYGAFIIGLACSSALVLEWTAIYRIVKRYMETTEEKIFWA